MSYTEFFHNTADGTRLYARTWDGTGSQAGTVVLVHGLGEHIGRYDHVAQALNQAGYRVTGFDQRGHGKSPGLRGHIPSGEIAMSDIQEFVKLAHGTSERVFVYGHSMGGSFILKYGLTFPQGLTGVIATSPWLAASIPMPALKIKAGRILARVAPSARMANGLDLHGLSKDPTVCQRYKADPLVHDRVSAALAIEMFRNGDWLTAHPGDYPVPLLILHGSLDRIASPAATRHFAAKSGGNVSYHEWEGGFHELHNEPEKDAVLKTIVTWINSTR